MPESPRRSEPGELAERLAEAFLADFWAAQPRGEATVRVGDADLVLVYRSTPEVQRQLYLSWLPVSSAPSSWRSQR